MDLLSKLKYYNLPFKKIHLLIFRSFLGPFMVGFSVVLFVLVLQFLARYLDEILGKGVDAILLGKVFLYACGTLVPMALPLAVLLSSLMTLGNMGERYELAAIKSSGISLYQLVKPMTFFVMILTLFSLHFSFYVLPKSNLKLFSLIFDLSKVKPTFAISPGHFYSGIDGFTIHTSDVDQKRDMLYKVKIYDHSDKKRRGNYKVILADSARMYSHHNGAVITMQLFSGVNHEEYPVKRGEPNQFSYGRTYFDSLNFHFQLKGFDFEETGTLRMSPHQYMKDIHELSAAVDSLKIKERLSYLKLMDYMMPIIRVDSTVAIDDTVGKPEPGKTKIWQYFDEDQQLDIVSKALNQARTVKNYASFTFDKAKDEATRKRKYHIEYYSRIAMPLSCLIFLIIGAPLGAIIRKGGIGMPVLISVLFFIFFYVMTIQGKKFARDEIMPVWLGVFLPLFMLAPIGILLTYQSTTDSKLMSLSTWQNFFEGLFGRFRKKKPVVEPEGEEEIRSQFKSRK
ncbi:MAG: LptF/LptG family permease [Bacteroidia bacterium]|nr:LptF/LptG family permease [Bacteroidia bacterium]